MGLVLVLPFSVRWVEEELEAFLFVMGCLAVTMSGLWSRRLVGEALAFGLGGRDLAREVLEHRLRSEKDQEEKDKISHLEARN